MYDACTPARRCTSCAKEMRMDMALIIDYWFIGFCIVAFVLLYFMGKK